MKPSSFLDSIGGDGPIDPAALAARLEAPVGALAFAVGLPAGVLVERAQWRAPAIQGRLREFATIIDAVLPWCGPAPQAFAWYRAQPLVSFGRTAESLVRAGQADALQRHLARIADGGYA